MNILLLCHLIRLFRHVGPLCRRRCGLCVLASVHRMQPPVVLDKTAVQLLPLLGLNMMATKHFPGNVYCGFPFDLIPVRRWVLLTCESAPSDIYCETRHLKKRAVMA